MQEHYKRMFELWSKTEIYKRRLAEAKKVISDFLQKEGKKYIAYSGGKDSTALMHMVLQQDKETMVLHWDYGRYYVPYKYLNQIISNAKLIGAKNLIIKTSKKYEIMKRNAINVLGVEYLGKLIPQLISDGFSVSFIGLRAEESIKRRFTTKEFYEYKKIYNVYPLKNFTYKDVWAYIVSNNIPYLNHYDTYSQIEDISKIRFTTLFDPEFKHFGLENTDKFINWREHNVA